MIRKSNDLGRCCQCGTRAESQYTSEDSIGKDIVIRYACPRCGYEWDHDCLIKDNYRKFIQVRSRIWQESRLMDTLEERLNA
jgi:hypothetical protein